MKDKEVTFEMVENDVIDEYEPLAREFFPLVLDQNYNECFISDLSSLSDFTTMGHGSPDEDAELIARVHRHYPGLEPFDIHITFVELFRRIEARNKVQ